MMKTDSTSYRSGFMFWALSPFLLAFLVAMPFLIPKWNSTTVILMVGLESLCVLVLLGLLNPLRFWWAWRGVGALIFLAYAAYVISMFIESGGKITVGWSRAETSVFNAVLGLLVFGLPGLLYAILGRLTFRLKREIDESELTESEDADSEPERPGNN
jgi:hypothetical protein